MTSEPQNIVTHLGNLTIGPLHPLRLMAIINASPESYYAGSVSVGRQAIQDAAERAAEEGADLIDVGAMSTAPYKTTEISEQEEIDRMGEAVAAARIASGLPVTADTSRAKVARVALDMGACAINDVTGLEGDPEMGKLIAERNVSAILMANENPVETQLALPPIDIVMTRIRFAINRALRADIPKNRIMVDPGIGFFRHQSRPWYEFDTMVLEKLDHLNELEIPYMISLSRKSFLGRLLNRENPEDRLGGSLAATIWAAHQGALVIRTHDVAQTRDALVIWNMFRSQDFPG